MTREEIVRYQEESVKRASMTPVAKHSQTKANQPKNFVRIYQTLGETA
ncbi:hypothetical protein ACRZER_003992 [Raoultella ornithinolytica]|jgi:hypothetical protein|uniref:Uncharacterized protein n=1 Tax=Raoultella ornithinolytica TaxID=54291 RepID=A0A6S4Y3G6_RAOOR|nr:MULTISPECIES: hypothetical protein [Klebsiella/Raoultella group]EKX4894082.1 hypothetical protein [Raoultella ornithinolytica]ELS5401953.1 hypothetical protein [Raoultella ornithinolytica]ELS5456731.1 hypothetical protein [Raoultella ornithinolytica]ELS5481200.1 hypothetical protein [Raoultella ornithinolytica]MBM6478482.1 hypothetical protein [Raoultella ornithinolytica]